MRRKQSPSPTKRGATTPSFANKSQQLLDEDEDSAMVDEEEDEETLKLQLAAIEAKLKLKKLQRNNSRSQANSSDAENRDRPEPKSASRSHPAGRVHSSRNQQLKPDCTTNEVKIPLSPTRRPIPQSEAKSPHRVLLGIDKGVRADDVSLRRAPTGRETRLYSDQSSRDGRESRFGSMCSRSTISSETSDVPRVKSFSERMAEIRSGDTARQNKREQVQNTRSSGFKLNTAEMQGYRAAAEEIRARGRSRSPVERRQQQDFRRDDVLRSYGNGTSSDGLQRSNTLPSVRREGRNHDHPSTQRAQDPSNPTKNATTTDSLRAASPSKRSMLSDETSHHDPLSQTHLSTRILPHTFVERTLSSSITPIRLPFLLKTVKAPDFELPDHIAGDFAVSGIIASVSKPYDHKDRKPIAADDATKWEQKWEDGRSSNAQRFMVLTLTDLKWTIDLFLFSSALPRYHRLSPGTVIVVLNPGIMPPKPGKIDTGAFSLTLHSGENTILEIGTARDLGFCKALRKDGKECGSWVDTRKTEFCDFHVDLKVQRTQAGRMGVNTGSNAFGPGGGRFGSWSRRGGHGRDGEIGLDKSDNPRARGPGPGPGRGATRNNGKGIRRDFSTGERYFISQAPLTSRPSTSVSSYSNSRPRSAAATIDAELDDPFLAEGTISRDSAGRAERMRKHLAAQAQERGIALKLGNMAAEGTRDTGSEYLRRREEDFDPKAEDARLQRRKLAKEDVLGMGRRGEKRGVEDVSLSPVRGGGRERGREVKKTRFVTEKGIREAGRESGVGVGGGEKEEDDFLDII